MMSKDPPEFDKKKYRMAAFLTNLKDLRKHDYNQQELEQLIKGQHFLTGMIAEKRDEFIARSPAAGIRIVKPGGSHGG